MTSVQSLSLTARPGGQVTLISNELWGTVVPSTDTVPRRNLWKIRTLPGSVGCTTLVFVWAHTADGAATPRTRAANKKTPMHNAPTLFMYVSPKFTLRFHLNLSSARDRVRRTSFRPLRFPRLWGALRRGRRPFRREPHMCTRACRER